MCKYKANVDLFKSVFHTTAFAIRFLLFFFRYFSIRFHSFSAQILRYFFSAFVLTVETFLFDFFLLFLHLRRRLANKMLNVIRQLNEYISRKLNTFNYMLPKHEKDFRMFESFSTHQYSVFLNALCCFLFLLLYQLKCNIFHSFSYWFSIVGKFVFIDEEVYIW